MTMNKGETLNWSDMDLIESPGHAIVGGFDSLDQVDEFIKKMGSQFLSLMHAGTTANGEEFSRSPLHWVNFANGSRVTSVRERFEELLIEPMGDTIRVDEPSAQVLMRRKMRGLMGDNPWIARIFFNVAVPYRPTTEEVVLGYAGLRVTVSRGVRRRIGQGVDGDSMSVVKNFEAGLRTATTPDGLWPRVTTFAF